MKIYLIRKDANMKKYSNLQRYFDYLREEFWDCDTYNILKNLKNGYYDSRPDGSIRKFKAVCSVMDDLGPSALCIPQVRNVIEEELKQTSYYDKSK